MKEFFYLHNNAPKYDPFKHYFDQTIEVIEFYKKELDKIIHGVTIDGVYFSGWLYFHINYFMTSIPVKNKNGFGTEDKVMLPVLRDNEWYIQECILEALEKQKFIALFGTRRFGKSVIEASVGYWRALVMQNLTVQMVCGSSDDLAMLVDKVKTNWDYIHPAFKLPVTKSQWGDSIEFGIRETSQQKKKFSNIQLTIIDDTSKKSSEKTAGGAPSAFIVDEFAKFKFIPMLEAAMPAFNTPFGLKTLVMFVGTGGNKELSQDAKKLMDNPDAYNFLPMNWDRLDTMVKDPEFVTWKRRNFGIFVPAQMSYMDKLIKKEIGMDEFKEVNSPKLSKIKIQVTEWGKSREVIKNTRLLKTGDALSKHKMYYPFDPLECFINRIDNPFPAHLAQKTLEKLEEQGNTGKPVRLVNTGDGKISASQVHGNANIDRIPYPYKGDGNKDAPIFLYTDIPLESSYDVFIGGNDFYKLKDSSTDSVATFYIFERRHLGNPIEKIVLSYAARPERTNSLYTNIEMGLEAFAARTFVENVDATPFFQHLQNKGKDYRLLAEGLDFSKMINPNSRPKINWGYYPTDKNKAHILSTFIEYCWEEVVIGVNEDGVEIKKCGIEFIEDPDLLKEILNFNFEGNFDRIIAAASAVAYCRYLDGLHIQAVLPGQYKITEAESKKKRKKLMHSMYPTKYRSGRVY